MAIYLNRSGSNGEYEQRFLDEGRIYFTWQGLTPDMGRLSGLDDFYALFEKTYPNWKKGKCQNHARQAIQFVGRMQIGDWIVMPSKHNPTIHFGEVTGDYEYMPSGEDRFKHTRKVEWFAQDVPRERFDQDILYSFGAFLTVCRIQRNNAEERIKEMANNEWHVPKTSKAVLGMQEGDGASDEANTAVDLEETAYDQISRLILSRFKGHGLASLVGAILEAQGYTIHQPPAGPDHGVDLLAAPGALGFGKPSICVQVKSTDSPIERGVLDQLIGTMQNFNAQHGLLVSWGGFKQSVEKERANQFFRVRLWNRDDFIEQLLATYDRLDESVRVHLPFKRIWAVAQTEDDD